MESKQFSTSRGHVILVGDMLARYQPDALRYYICAAGPETSDADFTWADFVLRTNSELVAGWGNLVNRTATMMAKSFGEIPACRAARADGRGRARRRAGRLRHRRRPGRPAAAAPAHRRGDAGGRRGEQVPHRHRALQDEGRVAARAAGDRAARRRPVRRSTATRSWRRSCRTRPTRCTWRSAARASSCRCRGSSTSRTSTPTTAPGWTSTRHHRRLLRYARAGSRARSPWARRSRSRRRSSPSSTRPSWTRSCARLAEPGA